MEEVLAVVVLVVCNIMYLCFVEELAIGHDVFKNSWEFSSNGQKRQ